MPVEEFNRDLEAGNLQKELSKNLTKLLFENARSAAFVGTSAVPPFEKNISSYHETEPFPDVCCIGPYSVARERHTVQIS